MARIVISTDARCVHGDGFGVGAESHWIGGMQEAGFGRDVVGFVGRQGVSGWTQETFGAWWLLAGSGFDGRDRDGTNRVLPIRRGVCGGGLVCRVRSG